MPSNLRSFGPDPQFSALPQPVQHCVTTGQATQSCDDVIANYCKSNPSQTICSCINSSVACPIFADPICANSPFSYVPSKYAANSDLTKACQQEPICINYIEMDSAGNTTGMIIQNCSQSNIQPIGTGNYIIYVLIVLIIVVLTCYIVIQITLKYRLKTN